MITATKNGINRNFSQMQWSNMPKDKFGWIAISEAEAQIVNPSIVQKKMVAGAVVVTKVVPDEIIIQGKKEEMEGLPGEGIQLNDDLPEIKRKPGRPSK
jgi:hypothetical protein